MPFFLEGFIEETESRFKYLYVVKKRYSWKFDTSENIKWIGQ